MSWDSFKDLAKTKVGHKKIYQHAQAYLVVAEANKLLVDFFPHAKNRAKAVYLRKQILVVAVLDDELISQLTAHRWLFLQTLNKKFPEQMISDWQFLT